MAWRKGSRKTALVTGGAGFIGSHLCDRLLSLGTAVICADNLRTSHEHNIAHLRDNPAFEFRHHDVSEPLAVEVDEIWNLACPASPVHYQNDPVATIRTSVLGAVNLLELATRLGCRIFQASTSEVYGDPLVHPQRETYWGNVNPIGPRACYDEGKRCAETLFFDHHRQFGTDIKVARLFNTYGPRMQPGDGRVVSNFIVQALAGDPITLYGSGEQTRSFCHVDDMIDAFIALMDTPAGVTGPVNLGNPDEITILELARMVVASTGTRSKIVHLPPATDDPVRRRPDISLAGSLLDWQPKIALAQGLESTIDAFRSAHAGTAPAKLPIRT